MDLINKPPLLRTQLLPLSSQELSDYQMSQTKPTIIFVPGGWHEPHVFEPVSTILQSRGYKTVLVSLPSVGASPPLDDFQPDVAAVRAAIASSVDAGSEVVLFAHSYGGIPASEAVKGLTKSDLQSQGKPGGVAHFMLCASFLIPEGAASIDPEQGPSPQYKVVEDGMEIVTIDPITTFYNDLPREAAERYAAALKRQSYKVFASKQTYSAWRHVPTTYLYTENDMALPVQYQKMFVEGSGVNIKTETFDSGHSVFLTMPEKVADSIRRAAGESV
ncbi:hypothetical protein FRC05_003510 [Tulasnella sp. 425]|nr:hypothetical protein FRC05_003510 [Tulasnella sp. 425]